MTKIMATITGKRETEFVNILGTATVPIQHTFPVKRWFGPGDERDVFLIDHEALRSEQYEALVAHMMALSGFGFTRSYCERRLLQVGYPIPTSDCVLSVDDPPRET